MHRPAAIPDDEFNAPRRAPRFFAVSPHLDDAVLGCSTLLSLRSGAVVCTVFAGEPARPARTPWDEAGGFADSHEAMAARREEDERALALWAARAVRLDFLDAQYGATPTVSAVADAIAAQFERFASRTLVCPLGLWHSDHELVGAACRSLLLTGRLRACIAYEDPIYRAIPGALSAGFARLESQRLRASPLPLQPLAPRRAAAIKLRAVRAYGSQLRAFGSFPLDVARTERYWRLERA